MLYTGLLFILVNMLSEKSKLAYQWLRQLMNIWELDQLLAGSHFSLLSDHVTFTSPVQPLKRRNIISEVLRSCHFQYWPVCDNHSQRYYHIMIDYLHVGTYPHQQCPQHNEALHRNKKRDTRGLPRRHSPVIQLRSSWLLPKFDNFSTLYMVSSCFEWMDGPMRYKPLFRKATEAWHQGWQFFKSGKKPGWIFLKWRHHRASEQGRWINILQEYYPDLEHVLIYDNATTHLKHAEDALSTRKMLKGIPGMVVILQEQGIM